MANSISSPPHMLMFPLPAQGDLNPMLQLAQLISLANINVTFLNSTHNHQRMAQHTDLEARFSRYPGFQFACISDGLPEDHPRAGGNWLVELLSGLKSNATPFLRERLHGSAHTTPVTCLIVDSVLGFVFEIANEFGVPIIEFKATGACYLWAESCFPQLFENGEIPVKGNEEMDEFVQSVPGMTSFLRRRDLPNFCRATSGESISLIHSIVEAWQSRVTHPIILNTFEDLEGTVVSLLKAHFSKIYTVGPLQAHLKDKLGANEGSLSSSTTLWKEDRSCISWLDQKPNKSVVYVSFGSLTYLSRDQFLEIWAGLVQSKKYFLWVVRPNMIKNNESNVLTPDEILEGTKERGCMVDWAPQEEVLAHRAVGGFLTHCGWNSTLESIVAGVPMVCWPCFYDQLVNSRYVSEVWKIGLDMKDTCDRTIVENMIDDLMDGKKHELESSVVEMSCLAKKSIEEKGSSHCNLNHLIEDIKAMAKKL